MRPFHRARCAGLLWVAIAASAACDDGPGPSPDAAISGDGQPEPGADAEPGTDGSPDGAPEDGDPPPLDVGADAAPIDMAPAPIDTAPIAAALDEALSAAPEGITGMTLLVFDADDTRVIALNAGDFAPDRRVPVASASKMVSALVFLRLIEEGALTFESTPGEVLGWQGPHAAATLDTLNAFTSGMPGDALCTAILRQTLAVCAASMEGLDPIGAPGEVFDYGPTHQHVAAAMAEAVTGETWDALFRRTLTRPLGIDDPALRYVTRPQQAQGDINPLIAGGLIATPEEYARILSVVFHRGRVDGAPHIAEASVDRMGRNRYVEADIAGSPAMLLGYDYRYGFGSWLECDGPVASCPVISSPGAFGFTPWVDWEAGYYAVLAMDSGGSGGAAFGTPLHEELKPLIRAALGRG